MNRSETLSKLAPALVKGSYNGSIIICHDDGTVELFCSRLKRVKRTGGSLSGGGYMEIQINGKAAKIHRLMAAAFLPGFDDSLQVDHANGDKADNRPENLRMVTGSQNCRGYKSPPRSRQGSRFRGVTKRGDTYRAYCKTDDNREYVGGYKIETDAAKARDAVAYANGYSPEGLNCGVREAQNLLLCALHVANN